MITGNLVLYFSKTGRGQEFLDGKMGKLNDLMTPDIDNGKKTGTRRLNRMDWIFQMPSLVEPWG
jgi:hypothetical protein